MVVRQLKYYPDQPDLDGLDIKQLLDDKQRLKEELSSELVTTLSGEDTFPTVPDSLNDEGGGLRSISGPLRDSDHIPAGFVGEEISLYQRIDRTRYSTIIGSAITQYKSSLDRVRNRQGGMISQDHTCQIAMHVISDAIATHLRPGQDDSAYRSYVDQQVASGNTVLNPQVIARLELENCVMKTIIAKQFLDRLGFQSTMRMSKGEGHNYLTVKTGAITRRLDVNSPKRIEHEDGVFWAANMETSTSGESAMRRAA